jgi:hypothetical protein
MLEIGALSPCNHAATMPWISNTPIDLNSQHPDILQQDFLHRPLPASEGEKYDIVSCSLVLNFVPEPQSRGAQNYRSHQLLTLNGIRMLIRIVRANAAFDTRTTQGSWSHVLGFAETLCREFPIPRPSASRQNNAPYRICRGSLQEPGGSKGGLQPLAESVAES